MTALAADRQTRTRATGAVRTRKGDVAAAAVIYFGALIARNAGGYIVPASDAAALSVVGVSENFVDNTAGADGALTLNYSTNLDVELDNAGGAIVQASKGAPCYVADDASVTTAAVAVHDVLAGIVADFTATKVWVHVDEAMSSAVLAAPLEGDSIDTVANRAVSPAVITSGIEVVIPIDIPDHATQTLVYVNGEKLEITRVEVLKNGAGAANTIQVTDSADAAITDAIAAAVDKARTTSATVDPAKRVLAANAGFKIIATKEAGTMAALVLIYAIKRA